MCVGACVHWHDSDVTTKLYFAQLRIDIISDHVIAASAGQRERSRSGSVISHFLKTVHDDNEILTTSSSMLASRRRELEEALFANFEQKRRDVRHHSR